MNKIKYGLKNVHYAMATIDPQTNTATYSAPKRMPGAVSLSMDPSGESSSFYADNIAYATFGANAGYEGDLELAMIPDSFRIECLGEVVDEESGIQFETTDAVTKMFALLFQIEGDDTATRHVLYNCTASRTSIEAETTEEEIEVKTESMTLKASAVYNAKLDKDICKGKISDKESDAYKNWFTAVQQA